LGIFGSKYQTTFHLESSNILLWENNHHANYTIAS